MGPDHIKEIHRASGSNLGGRNVDGLFTKFLITLFGEENIATIIKENLVDWFKMIDDLEKAKKKVVSRSSEDTFSLKPSKACHWDQDYFNEVPDAIKKGVRLKKNGHLVISTNILTEMIAKVAHQIGEHIIKLLQEVELKGLDAILLVGGFVNSPIIVEEMRNLVGEKIRLIVPENSELCVVKGAVLFGWKRDIIRSRKNRYTYGFGSSDNFIEGEHDESRSFTNNNGEKKCNNCFHKLVTINEDLPIDKYVEFVASHPYLDGEYLSLIHI